MTYKRLSVSALADASYKLDRIIVHCLESSKTIERTSEEYGNLSFKFWDMRDYAVTFYACHDNELEIWAWKHEGSYQEGGLCVYEEDDYRPEKSL